MAGTWSRPAQAAPFAVGAIVLLNDGAVLAQDDGSPLTWWRLRPDRTGFYEAAPWTQAASSARARRGFGAAVLRDGRVIVYGGESGDGTADESLAPEIYDPAANRWSDAPEHPDWNWRGAIPGSVLPGGEVLLGGASGGECVLLDSEAASWAAAGRKLNGSSVGESWTLLQDGAVLSIDGVGHPRTERYAGGVWGENAPVPEDADLVDGARGRAGPAVLLPDGRVFAAGAAGHTAIFTPGAAGAWTKGPALLAGEENLSAMGGPACLLPGGRVLLVAGRGEAAAAARSVALIFANGVIAPLEDQPDSLAAVAPERCRLLVLPSGEVMLTTGTRTVEFFTVEAAAMDAPVPPLPAAQDAAPVRNAAQDRALQEEMLWRDLNEVHLLMDFICGKADRSIADMRDIPNPDMAPNAPQMLAARKALHDVSAIRFPPQGSPDEKARQAQLLLLVKDQLNHIAYPARGLSIAYTAMFSGTAGSSGAAAKSHAGGRSSWPGEPPGGPGPHAGPDGRKRQVTGFAIASYPNLEQDAQDFKWWFGFMPFLALFWLVITVGIYWDVALSSHALRTDFAGITVADADCNIDPATKQYASTPPAKLRQACDVLLAAEKAGISAREVLARDGRAALFIYHWWWHPVGWIVHDFGPRPEDQVGAADFHGPCQLLGSCDYEADVSAFAVVVLSVFTDYILPMMFGVLGTFAGLIRGILAKMRDSTLTPRDYRQVTMLIPLGAMAGLGVGLLVSPSAVVAATGALPLSLSASALAFLAGYGADAFFSMIDTLLSRIFTAGSPPTGSGSK